MDASSIVTICTAIATGVSIIGGSLIALWLKAKQASDQVHLVATDVAQDGRLNAQDKDISVLKREHAECQKQHRDMQVQFRTLATVCPVTEKACPLQRVWFPDLPNGAPTKVPIPVTSNDGHGAA